MSFAPMQGEPGALESAPLMVDGRAVDEPYQYLVTIEFGSFQFWYDWGEWDVDKLAYTKDASSKDPAADTIDDGPGWYGFDGVTNRIGVTYQAPQGVTNDTPWLELSLVLNPAMEIPAGATEATRVFNNSTVIEIYDDYDKDTKTFSGKLAELHANVQEPQELSPLAPTEGGETVHEYFLSLTGAPQNANGSSFRSPNAVSLGLICISIDLVDAPTT